MERVPTDAEDRPQQEIKITGAGPGLGPRVCWAGGWRAGVWAVQAGLHSARLQPRVGATPCFCPCTSCRGCERTSARKAQRLVTHAGVTVFTNPFQEMEDAEAAEAAAELKAKEAEAAGAAAGEKDEDYKVRGGAGAQARRCGPALACWKGRCALWAAWLCVRPRARLCLACCRPSKGAGAAAHAHARTRPRAVTLLPLAAAVVAAATQRGKWYSAPGAAPQPSPAAAPEEPQGAPRVGKYLPAALTGAVQAPRAAVAAEAGQGDAALMPPPAKRAKPAPAMSNFDAW